MLRRHSADLAVRPFDLLIIGGGIVGACAARDAARRGLSVALIERGDFGGGASSNSLKIVHGGLRHLQQLAFARVRESNRERAVWMRIAPHLVDPLPVLVPAYGRGAKGRSALRAGVALADLLGRDLNAGLPSDRRLPPGQTLDRDECLRMAPELDAPGLAGGVLFHDGRMYSSERLALSVLLGAKRAGAVLCNYAEADGPLRSGGAVVGATVLDHVSGERLEVRARVILNAAGGGAEAIARAFVPAPPPFPPLSVAVNLVFPALGHDIAFALPAPAPDRSEGGERRMLFVVPWRGLSMVGTGHYPAGDGFPGDAGAAVERFAVEVRSAFRERGVLPPDPVVVHRGWIPAAPPDGGRPLRRARIVDHAPHGAPGVVSVISVKYTTGRLAAEEAVDLVVRKLGYAHKWGDTATTPLPGAPHGPVEELLRTARAEVGDLVPPDVLEHLVRAYGTAYDRVLAWRGEMPGWDTRVVPDAPVIAAQLAQGARDEMACTVDDLLERRTELGARGLVTPRARQLAGAILARYGATAAGAPEV